MRDDWKFSVIEGVQIPCADKVADFVTFFSVLTHATHEESFKYLQEASRCLKVGGRRSHLVPGVSDPMPLGNLHRISQSKGGWTFDSVSRSRRHRGVGRS
jgi:ubiquinone/menaquinone biosynthesis C-methylase UbiE